MFLPQDSQKLPAPQDHNPNISSAAVHRSGTTKLAKQTPVPTRVITFRNSFNLSLVLNTSDVSVDMDVVLFSFSTL
jgi:hypothetical protein